MPSRAPDHALKRLVAEIASAAPYDVEAILGALEPPQRLRVQGLLRDLLGQPLLAKSPAHVKEPVPTAVTFMSGLSPWLAARLEESAALKPALRHWRVDHTPAEDAVPPFAMTGAALVGLQDAARSLGTGQAAEVSNPPAIPAWLARLRKLARVGWGPQ